MKRCLLPVILAALALAGLSARRDNIRTYNATAPGAHGGHSQRAAAERADRGSPPAAAPHTLVFPDCVLRNLGSPGNRLSEAEGINASGCVVGQAATTRGRNRAFLFQEGALRDLGTLPGAGHSTARAVNRLGQAVGWSDSPSGGQRAVLFEAGTAKDLGTLGTDSEAYAINDAGQIVGESTRPDGTIGAFLYHDGVMRDLGTLGGSGSGARHINNSGEVVGGAYTGTGAWHAFLCRAGVMRDLGTLGGRESVAHAINDAGEVVGGAATPSGYHAFVFRRGRMRDLGTLGGGSVSVAYAINNRGEIVGMSRTHGDTPHAFLYADGVMTDLNRWISPHCGWVLRSARAINAAGQIAGDGLFHGRRRAFLLTPKAALARSSSAGGAYLVISR